MFPKEKRLVLLGDMAASPEILKGREIVTPPTRICHFKKAHNEGGTFIRLEVKGYKGEATTTMQPSPTKCNAFKVLYRQ